MRYFLLTISAFIALVIFSSCKKNGSTTKTNNSDTVTNNNNDSSVTKSSQFFTVTVNDSTTYNYSINSNDTLGYYDYGDSLAISAWHNADGNIYHNANDSEFDMQFLTPTIAVGSNEVLQEFDLQSSPGSTGQAGFSGTSTSPMYVHITEYGAVGQYVSGNYAGTITDPHTSKNYTLSGSFRIKRAPYDPPY